ncbi:MULTISPECIES: hypothetical protein [unclassified Coleofasciculus]|uniref:hypothetical protein n=1 Tax=unclassified Coleofasciculus TaxID=2692782 RepID=UPI0018806F43|nr:MULTISPECIES: hypothetical protein [unclassified Coleofasciculus]MBE9126306.1 hypothetical protein [Coleofasciculus sp. LEGE 07081]MBE9149225.1 hypothetical protein [Coleofasciculus sp. LEGE 07092]
MKIHSSHLLVSLLLLIFPLSCAASKSSRTCQYDPDSGKPNPLGMRSYITITEEENNTIFTYEQFPSNVAENITLATKRELTLYNTSLDTARVILLQNKNYYSELVGYDDPEGFAPVNEVLTCE